MKTHPNQKTLKLIETFNRTEADFPRDKVLHFWLEQGAEQHPDQTAILFKNQPLSYAQLNGKANGVAQKLRDMGLGPGKIAAVMVERSFEMMIGLFAILKAGGAYLPVAPDNPPKRIEYILKDSSAAVLLTQAKWQKNIPWDGPVVNLDDPALYENPGENPAPGVSPDDPAYVIYTSGTTGKPKGVMVEHGSIVNRLHWMQKNYPLTPADTLMQKTPFTFDVSLWELFWWSMVGAKLCVMLPGFERFPQAIVETVEKGGVTVMHFVPSMLNAFLNYIKDTGTDDISRMKSLRRVFCSGEALKVSQVDNFHQVLHRPNGTVLTNLYGPTEATVDVTYFDCLPGAELEKVPIGKPIDNIQLYVLDRDTGAQKGIGETGELCIAGVGVARGYLNRPELTAEKFPPGTEGPCSLPSRFYKTGDLARWMEDGNIDFLGRVDHQVKIRGLRIELEEIESGLMQHPAIKDAVVLVEEKTETIVNLLAYIVPREEVPDQELVKHLRNFLPPYMIPNRFIRLEKIPLTPNGKVDRKTLKA